MTMKGAIKHYLVPHSGNNYRPHFFRARVIALVTCFSVMIFVLAIAYSTAISRVNFLAAVLPSVLVDLANQDRQIYNLNPLVPNAVLAAAAEDKAQDMANYSYFSHNSPGGVTP